MKIEIKNNWNDITWNEYEQLEQILTSDIPADYKSIHIVSLLTGKDIDEIEALPVSKFSKLAEQLSFIDIDPEYRTHKFKYVINGREYDFKGKLDEITTAQYIDYRSYMDQDEKSVVDLLSVFLIPSGHEYNDGYDIEQVKSDIGDMSWLDVKAATFFFNKWLATYILTLKSSLLKTMKKTLKGKTYQERKKIKQDMKELEIYLNNSASSLLFYQYVNFPIPLLTK